MGLQALLHKPPLPLTPASTEVPGAPVSLNKHLFGGF